MKYVCRFVSQNKTKIKVMRKITIEEKHMIRRAKRDAQKIRIVMLMDGLYKYNMTPSLIVKPYAFCNHTFTKGNDTE